MNDVQLLYNWNDVRDRFLAWRDAHEDVLPPGGAQFVRPTTQRVLIGYAENRHDQLAMSEWLDDLFGPRYDSNRKIIFLESVGGSERVLPIEFLPITEGESAPHLVQRPRLAPPSIVWFGTHPQFPAALDTLDGCPPVLCLHAYKGGVGRTTTALGLALGFAATVPVLLVDFDLEAPGLSILYHSRQPNPTVSAADLLTLAHGDVSPDCEATIALVSERLRDQADGNIFVLPSFRWSRADVGSAGYLDISPDDLTQSTQRSPYLLGTLLARIGARIGAGMVVVDLRAGLTDLAAALLLDPRLRHLQLTTLNGQAIEGSRSVLSRLGKAASSAPHSVPISMPAIVLNQIPMLLQGTAVETDAIEKLQQVIEENYPRPTGEREGQPADGGLDLVEADQGAVVARVNYATELAALPSDWGKAIAAIRNSSLPSLLARDLEGFLPAAMVPAPEPATQPDSAAATEASAGNLADRHAAELAAYAERLTYAEQGAETDFLKTQALRRLAADAISNPPVAVLVGARGAGKTFTCMRLVDSGDWNLFVRQVNGSQGAISARMLPVFWSAALKPEPWETHLTCRAKVAADLGCDNPPDLTEMHSRAQELFGAAVTPRDFREAWLTLIAHSAGAPGWEDFLSRLQKSGHRIVGIVDGFENLFPRFQDDEGQKKAIRSILQDVPQFLRQLPGRQLGLIVATRRDIVGSAIPQNVEQFLDLYASYRLRWNWAEASALVAWVARNSRIIEISDEAISDFPAQPQADREERLRPLWGSKVGPDNSKEARSLEWVMSYLSDFNGQLQARDLVRFLAAAAKRSQGGKRPDSRVLAPAAMRNAIEDCSRERVKEIKDENVALREIFDRLAQTTPDLRFNPLGPDDLSRLDLSKEDIDLLALNGALFLSKGEYYVPEILRVGLGFRYAGGARKKVVGLMREAASRNRAGF